jgi:hypothetical protein
MFVYNFCYILSCHYILIGLLSFYEEKVLLDHHTVCVYVCLSQYLSIQGLNEISDYRENCDIVPLDVTPAS